MDLEAVDARLPDRVGTNAERGRLAQIDDVIDEAFSTGDRAFRSSAITREEGLFLRRLASGQQVKRTIEIGCANGISALYLCSGLLGKQGAAHTAIDPFQQTGFQGRGVENVRRAGIDFFGLIERPSEIALPALLQDGARYDLAFIDGLHTADQTMIDFYFLDRMLRVGGILVFDDVNSRAVNKVARYVSTYPNYRLVGTAGERGKQRQTINAVKAALSIAFWPVRKMSEKLFLEVFDVSLLDPKLLWSLDFHSMAAFEKTGECDRDTNWYRGI